jgi:hypothetical protein
MLARKFEMMPTATHIVTEILLDNNQVGLKNKNVARVTAHFMESRSRHDSDVTNKNHN